MNITSMHASHEFALFILMTSLEVLSLPNCDGRVFRAHVRVCMCVCFVRAAYYTCVAGDVGGRRVLDAAVPKRKILPRGVPFLRRSDHSQSRSGRGHVREGFMKSHPASVQFFARDENIKARHSFVCCAVKWVLCAQRNRQTTGSRHELVAGGHG